MNGWTLYRNRLKYSKNQTVKQTQEQEQVQANAMKGSRNCSKDEHLKRVSKSRNQY